MDGAVEDAVSGVGVDANGASSALLERVAGLNATLAKALVACRPFASRNDLRRVKGLGPKTFENVADASAVNFQLLVAQMTINFNEQTVAVPPFAQP